MPSAPGVHMNFCTQSMETFHEYHRKQKLLILPSTAEVPFGKMIPQKRNNLKRGIFLLEMSQLSYAMKLTPRQPVEKIGWDPF